MSSLSWKINRIKAMSPAEIIFRLFRSVNTKVERKKVASGWYPECPVEVSGGSPLFEGSIEDVISTWNSQYGVFDFRSVDTLLSKIDIFGEFSIDVTNGIDWHKDPDTGIKAPLIFGKDIDYRDNDLVGNCKTLWEISRHKHLVPLAFAYAVSGDKKYLSAIVDQIDGWLEQNPFAMGVNWCSSLEVSLRLIAWSFVHHLISLRESHGLFSAVSNTESLKLSIYHHLYFIFNYLSRHSSANNHLIGELTGIWVGTKAFDLGDVGEKWGRFAKQELEREASKQVYEDGVSKEQATYYHLWVAEYLFLNWLIGIRYGDEFSDAFTLRINKMYQFLKSLQPPNGTVPQIGDSDDGMVVVFHESEERDPYLAFIETIELIKKKSSGENVLKTQRAFWYDLIYASRPSPRLWLDDDKARSKKRLQVYPQGGYCVVKDRDFHLVFDAGSLGYPSIAAHGHADALSLIYAYKGIWFLVDTGTYCYHTDLKWRNHFRGTASHNTIKLNHKDQSEIGGAFLWLRKSVVEGFRSSDDGNKVTMEGSVTGYASNATHWRKVVFESSLDQITIIDTLSGKQMDEADINFHFNPEVDLAWSEEDGFFIASHTRSGDKFKILVETAGITWKLYKGSVDPIAGWYSETLGKKVEAFTLRGNKRSDFAYSKPIVTKIALFS